MKSRETSAVVIKFGGSAATNETGADRTYLQQTLSVLRRDIVEEFSRAVFVIGGGSRVRREQEKYGTNEEKDRASMDILAEHAAQLAEIATEMGIFTDARIARTEEQLASLLESTEAFALSLGGLKIGQSTDAVAATAACKLAQMGYEVKLAILSNVEHMYTADPKKDPTAKPIASASLLELIYSGVLSDNPKKFTSGMSVTIDPVATKILKTSHEAGLAVLPLYFGHAQDTVSLNNFLGDREIPSGTLVTAKSSGIRLAR